MVVQAIRITMKTYKMTVKTQQFYYNLLLQGPEVVDYNKTVGF